MLAPLFSATGAPPGGHSGRRTGLRSPADHGREAVTDCYLDVNANRGREPEFLDLTRPWLYSP